MLVYEITLKNYQTNSIHSREIYVDSRTRAEAEGRILRTFDNLIKFNYLRKGELPHETFKHDERGKYNIKPINEKSKRLTIKSKILDYLSNKNSCKSNELSNMFGICAKSVRNSVKDEFKYSPQLRCYVRFKPHTN